MRIRHYGIMLLVLVGVIPITGAGVFMINRAERTALDAVRLGNERVAVRAAGHLAAFVQEKLLLLRTVATSLAPTVGLTAKQAERVAKNYRIVFPHVSEIDIVGEDCSEIATGRLDGVTRKRCGEPAVDRARSGKVYLGDVVLSKEFAPVMTMALPIDVAGEVVGVVVADIDMVDIWSAVKQVRVGDTGYARLVGRDGTLIGHGDPEERRRVFLREKDPFIDQIRAAPSGLGIRYHNSQGREVIALAADVPDAGWTVIVEQPIDEAFASTKTMRKALIVGIGAAAAIAILIGLFLGGSPIRSLEAMRKHTREVAKGNFDVRVEVPKLHELKLLAISLNDMAGEIKQLHSQIAAAERLNTFAGVAAGLAHDIRAPIESVRSAIEALVIDPSSDEAKEIMTLCAKEYIPRLHRYVRDLQRIAHDGRIPLEFVQVTPATIAARVAEEAGKQKKWHGIEFRAEGQAKPFTADESLVTRAIYNLVSNGADACTLRKPPSGSVTIRVSDATDSDALLFEVVDTGVGISKDRLANLLSSDFKSTKRSSGVGLGLGVARHVAISHGGHITVDSEEGIGSTFRLTLPRGRSFTT